jgi:hypothetical protein
MEIVKAHLAAGDVPAALRIRERMDAFWKVEALAAIVEGLAARKGK